MNFSAFSEFCVPKTRPSTVEPSTNMKPEPAEESDNISLHSDSSYVLDMEQIDSASIRQSVNGLPAELVEREKIEAAEVAHEVFAQPIDIPKREERADDTSDEDIKSIQSDLSDTLTEGADTNDMAKSTAELGQGEPMDPFAIEDTSYLLEQRLLGMKEVLHEELNLDPATAAEMDHLIEKGISIIVREFGKKFDELEDEIQVHKKLQEDATTKYCIQRSKNENLNAEITEMKAKRERQSLAKTRLRETLRMQNDALKLAYDHVNSASQKNQAKIEGLERELVLAEKQNRIIYDAFMREKTKNSMLVNRWGELNCKPNSVHNEAKCDAKDTIKALEHNIQTLNQRVKELESITGAQNKALSKQAELEDQIKRLRVACEEKEERIQRLQVEKDNEIYNYNLTITEYDNREKVDAEKIETLAKKLRQAIEERRRLESQLATITERMSDFAASTSPSLSQTTQLEITIVKALSCMQRMLTKYDLILVKTEDAIHDLHRVAEETSLHPQRVNNVRPAMYDSLAAVRRIKDIILERRRLSSQVQSLLAQVNNIDQTGSSIEMSTTDDA